MKTDNVCVKCSSDDLQVRYIPARKLINHSGRQRVETEFVTSDQYDFFWKLTAAKEHLHKHCRNCQYAWRENVAEQAQTELSREA